MSRGTSGGFDSRVLPTPGPRLSLVLSCALTSAPAAPEETSPGESSGLAALLQTSDTATRGATSPAPSTRCGPHKYDAHKPERAPRRALEKNPDNVRAHVYLADLYRKEGHPDRARAETEQALAHAPGRYDAPEERRMQAVARAALEKS